MVTTVMVAVLVLLVWLHPRANGALGVFIFGIAIGGALGNITDRFYQGVGWGSGPVIDMIKYGNLFIGNVADAAIVFAAALTIIAAWMGKRILKPRAARTEAVAADSGAVPAP